MKGRSEAQRRREHSSVRQERWAGAGSAVLGMFGGSTAGSRTHLSGFSSVWHCCQAKAQFRWFARFHGGLAWQQKGGDNVGHHAGAAGVLSESCWFTLNLF